jgi:cell division protein FtsB
MARIKDFFIKYILKINPYVFVLLIFAGVMFFATDTNLYMRFKYDEKIRELNKEIKEYRKEIDENTKKLNSIRKDKEGLEKFAREEYYMKKENEDVYIIK